MIRRIVTTAAVLTSALGLPACAQPGAAPMNTLTPAEQAAGWRLLFDGRSTAGWRGYRMDSMPAGWRVVDGALTRVAAGGDIVTVEEFANFELALEWKIAPAGNSGIFFRVREDSDATFMSGPEMQVLDDAAHVDGESRLTAAGANYGLDPAPPGVVKPAGEWNAVRMVVNGAHVEHWLNGLKVVEYELWTPQWEAKVAQTKFAAWPGYGRAPRGHFALQDHGDWVAYRNVKIRVLP